MSCKKISNYMIMKYLIENINKYNFVTYWNNNKQPSGLQQATFTPLNELLYE